MLEPCVNWTGALNSKGYGVRTVEGHRWLAHRFAYVAVHGPLPAGVQLDHECRNRRCVRVDHLRPRTALEHNRSHLSKASAAELIERVLADGEARTRQELLEVVLTGGYTKAAIGPALWRLTRRGAITRRRRGVYAMA